VNILRKASSSSAFPVEAYRAEAKKIVGRFFAGQSGYRACIAALEDAFTVMPPGTSAEELALAREAMSDAFCALEMRRRESAT
jgi:hypothetical protein